MSPAVPESPRPGLSSLPCPPGFGEAVTIAPGLLWTRMPLPMKIGHINVYLLRDTDGWLAIDAGFGSDETCNAWEALLSGPLKGERLTGLLVTHAHVDHVGAARWLCDRFRIPLWMTEVEYLACRYNVSEGDRLRGASYGDFFVRAGWDRATVERIADYAHDFATGPIRLPETFRPLTPEAGLRIGGRRLAVFCGPGHSPAQALLYDAADGWLMSADHIFADAAPLLVVPSYAPDDDTYGRYLASLAEIEAAAGPDILLLPGHHGPGTDLAASAGLARRHHAARLEKVRAACRDGESTLRALCHLLFGPNLNGRQALFATFELLAYLNRLILSGKVQRRAAKDGVDRYASLQGTR